MLEQREQGAKFGQPGGLPDHCHPGEACPVPRYGGRRK